MVKESITYIYDYNRNETEKYAAFENRGRVPFLVFLLIFVLFRVENKTQEKKNTDMHLKDTQTQFRST